MANTLFDALFAPLANRTAPVFLRPDAPDIGGAAFLALVGRAAHALRAAGVGRGDRVAVQIAKSPEALAVYGGAMALGAVFLPLNPAYTAAELDYFIGNATPRLLLCDPSRATDLAALCQRHGTRLAGMDGAGQGSFADLMAVQPASVDPVLCDADDLAAILYTSGTTGRSKGAMLSHGNLLSNAAVLADLWQFTDRDVLLHALPIFHTHGLFVACNICLLTGAAMIFLPGFEADAVVGWLPRATALMGVPTFYTRLLDHPGFDRDLVAHMRLFISGSAPLLAETHARFETRTGQRILERYGMTETGMNTSNPCQGERRAGTVGLPLPGVELRIMAEGVPATAGAVGVIEVRGPNVFQGYWQMPEKTAEELRPDGWFITGDLGQVAADGYVSIVGRARDLIITGGYNVYPREVEQVLDDVPGVLESAVIGLPHVDFGEAVFAVLTPQPGHNVDLAAAEALLRQKLARFKQPKAMVVLPELPRNAMGKVQKNLLRQRYKGWFGG